MWEREGVRGVEEGVIIYVANFKVSILHIAGLLVSWPLFPLFYLQKVAF